LGRWGVVRVRLHAFFLLFVVGAFWAGQNVGERSLFDFTAVGLLVLLASVVWHEAAHCLVAHRLGGQVQTVFLWPFGGLTQLHVTFLPQHEFWMGLAGPLANLVACLGVAPAVLLSDESLRACFNPLAPPVPAGAMTLGAALALAFWINWVLALVNLLPAYPLDGSRIVRSLLWPRVGYTQAVRITVIFAQVTAVALVLFGLLCSQSYTFAWPALLLGGVFLFFAARFEGDRLQERAPESGTFGYDFSEGYTSLERTFEQATKPKRSFVRVWLDERRAAQDRRRAEIEESEDRRMDDVLARLHVVGLENLSAEDRRRRSSSRGRA